MNRHVSDSPWMRQLLWDLAMLELHAEIRAMRAAP